MTYQPPLKSPRAKNYSLRNKEFTNNSHPQEFIEELFKLLRYVEWDY